MTQTWQRAELNAASHGSDTPRNLPLLSRTSRSGTLAPEIRGLGGGGGKQRRYFPGLTVQGH